MKDIDRILVVSWMTQYCKKPISYGIALADKLGAELFVLHIVNTLWLQGWNLPMISVIDERRKDLERLKRELDSIIDHEKKKGMTIKDFVREGDPVDIILKTILEEKIDLVLLRTHEEGRTDRFLVGGSNDAVIRKVPCPVLLVKD